MCSWQCQLLFNMKKNNTSYRKNDINDTLSVAELVSKDYGITRVVDVTKLDVIDVPVFCSIRPKSESLSVNAGKGVLPIEAKVGAYMECLEFAISEKSKLLYEPKVMRLEDYKEYLKIRGFSLLDFCPIHKVEIDPQQEIHLTECVSIIDKKERFYIPSELVHHPYKSESVIFGSSTNGLASGNDVEEAILHATFEVIERHICTLNKFRNQLQKLSLSSIDDIEIKGLIDKCIQNDIEVIVKVMVGSILPFASCYLIDRSHNVRVVLADGHGCHLDFSIAIKRAIVEAIQSRMSHIHGGRDDITDGEQYIAKKGLDTDSVRRRAVEKVKHDYIGEIAYEELKKFNKVGTSIEEALEVTLSCLKESGFNDVFLHDYSYVENRLGFVKVIIPKMENFTFKSKRLGRILAEHIGGR